MEFVVAVTVICACAGCLCGHCLGELGLNCWGGAGAGIGIG